MNIYIKIEILARELEGRLLLALVAAERGHRVLLGDFSALLSHRLWLPPGVFHDKSLTPSTSKLALHGRLRDAGFLVTSQDEEHGLLDEFGTWADFAARRFSHESVAGAARCFMWGPHDRRILAGIYPDAASRIVATGSPRSDLWRPELDAFYARRSLIGVDERRPIVLFANQSAIVTDQNPFWRRIEDQRPRYFSGDDDERERAWYRRCVAEMRYLEHLIPAIRAVAREHPESQVVIRPHPIDAEGAWEALVGRYPNVTVLRSGSASTWIRRATVVVHNGSTIGFEAAAAGRPLVAFQPVADRAELVSNRLGRTAATTAELVDLVGTALAGADPAGGWHPERDVLHERLGPLRGPLAADRIVDEWDALGSTLPVRPRLRAARAHRVAELHRAAGVVRSRARSGPQARTFTTEHKFRAIPFSQATELAVDLGRTLGRFEGVTLKRRGRRLIEVLGR